MLKVKTLLQVVTVSSFGLLLFGVIASFFGPINTDILVAVLIVCAMSSIVNLLYLKKEQKKKNERN